MIKKIIAVFIAIVIVFGTIPIDVFANNSQEPAKFEDMPENWSRAALENAVENGLLSGVDGKIMPNEKLTRAQMATVITRAFGAKDKGNISKFSDVKASDWFYDSMSKAYKMGVIKGSNNKLNPKEPITRQEAFVMIARAFKLESADVLNKSFEDTDQISDWAKEEVYSVINNEYIQGSNGKINPKGNITRAEFAQVFYNIVKEYIQTEGTYKNLAKGNIMVSVPNVILKDLTIEGDLIIGDGVGEGDVILDSVKVRGRIVVRGGGENSIIIKGNSDISNIIVAKVDGVVSIKVQGDANVEIIYIDDESDDVNIEGQIGNLQLMASGIIVGAIDSQIKTIDIIGKNSKVIIDKDSKVENININKEAVGIKLEVVGIADKVTTQAPNTQITGKGKVSKVEVKEGGNNVKIETTNTKIQVDKGVTGVTLPPTPPSPSSSGGSSSGGTTVVSVSAITVTSQGDVTTVVNGKTLQMGVVVGPEDATNKKVTWFVTNGTGSATINSSGLLTATGVGTVTVKALAQDGSGKENTKEITIHADLTAYNAALAAVKEADYTTDSWNAYQVVVAANVATDTDKQADVDAATLAITNAQADLIIPVKSIEITGDGSVAKDDTLQLTATITPSNATNPDVTWSIETGGTGSATINTDGLLNPTSEGTVTVKVVSQYDTSITATKEITVTASKLDAAKANAKTDLDTYVDATDYAINNATELATAISDGKTAIDGASDIAGVNAALADAKAAIDTIKSDAQIAAEELATEKTNAKTELENYKVAANYTRNAAALSTAIANGKTAIDNATDIAGANTALANAKAVIDAIKSDKDLDDDDIATAKTNIEGESYTATQAEVSDAGVALSKAQALVSALELKETTATVVAGTLAEAVAGDSSTPAGTNGSYTFTVTIAKGAGTEVTTAEQTMTITATPYDSTEQDNTDIANAKTNIESATYIATQAEASDSAKALTKAEALVNALGTELKGTSVNVIAGTFTGAITGTEASVNGTDGSYTFTVKIIKGLGAEVTTTVQTMTITATSYDPTADNADIATAKAKIESEAYTATQALVADKDAAKTKVEAIITGLDTAGTIVEVVPGSFSGAIAGVEGVFEKIDGSYTFTVKINKGGGTEAITKELTLAITAETTTVTKASKVTVNGIELSESKPNLDDNTAHFDSSTGVLTLQGYNGAEIRTLYESNPDLIIKLIGDNNVTTTSSQNGIYNGHYGNIYITSDSDATLNVTSTSDNDYVYAIATNDQGGKSIIIGGKAKVTVTAKTTAASKKTSVVHAGKDFIIQDNASFTGTSTATASDSYGVFAKGKIIINTTGNIDIDCSASSGSYAFNGMSGVDIKNVTLMTLNKAATGSFIVGSQNLSRVAVNIKDNIATYRGGIPYELKVLNGQITAVQEGQIGVPYQGLENDEITIKANTIANFEFVKWTNGDGTDIDSSLFVSPTGVGSPEAKIKMPAKDLNIKAEYKSTLFVDKPTFNRGEQKIKWSVGEVTFSGSGDSFKLQKKTAGEWEVKTHPIINSTDAKNGFIEVNNNISNHTLYTPDGNYRLYFKVDGKDHYSKEFVVEWEDTITIPEIPGVTPPVTGATPVTTITATDQYTGTVTWSPTAIKFAGNTAYTAKITLKAKDGYKLDGVAENSFTVAGATVNNAANSGVITAVFPVTAAAPLGGTISITGTLMFGEVLTANTTLLTGNTGTLSYAWKRGTTTIGLNQATYTTVAADIDQTITCEVTSSVETGTVTGTASGIITKAKGPSAPPVVGTAKDADNEILVIGGEEKITVTIGKNMTGTYEYSVNGGTDWADLSAGDITGLTSATTSIQVREKATETVEAGSATTQSVTVTSIPVAVTGITVTGAGSATTIVTAEGTLQMSAAVLPEGATNKEVTWSVVDGTGKATINETGLLKATAGTASNGTVTVTATANDGSGITGTLVITISGQVDTVISIAAIQGVTAPVIGSTPVTTITETSQYTGTVVWSPTNDPFAGGTVYTATITLTAKTGFTLTGVAENSFTVAGATVNNAANSGVITAVFPATAAPDFALGSGTELDPYEVSSAEELNKVRNHLDKHFIQTENIILSGWSTGEGWQPIGDSSTPFKGTYDGDSKDITGLFINRPEAEYQGLFGKISKDATIKNCSVSGSVTGKDNVGGLVGSNDGGTISSCDAPSVSITGKDYVGGLVGFVRSSSGALATIEKSYASGSVKGVSKVGGLVGLNSMQGDNIGGSIKNSYTDVSVDATGSYVGGLIGHNDADYRHEETSIENCYSKGSVKSSLEGVEGKVYIGGLVGGNNHNIKNSYAVGKVIVTNGADGFIGGLIGRLMGGGKVTSSYYDSTTTEQTDTGKGVGETTANMKTQSTFVDWDFTNIWTIETGSYPTLR